MQPRHHVSVAAIALIKRFEGFRRAAALLPDGRWTIGYGHTRSAREGVQISEDDAAALLLYDLGEVSVVLNEVVFTPLTQNQFDALVSFAMNIGVEEFRRSAVLLRVNEGSMLQAASALELWRKADFEGERIVVDALIRRRAAEKALFLTPTDGYVPTPTPLVRPRVDLAPSESALAGGAVELTAPLEGETATVQREAPADDAPAQPTPSSTEAAAESVNSRLQAILDDLELSESRGPAEAAAPEPARTGATEPPIVLPLPDPSSHARRQQEQGDVEPFPQDSIEIGHSPDEPVEPFHAGDFDIERIEPGPMSYLPLALMLVVGVALLAVATFWFVHAHPNMGAIAPSVIGWILGLTGIGLLATSVYFLLERIGQDD